HTGVPRRALDVETVEHCGCFRLEPLRGPAPMSSGRALRHLIIGTRGPGRTAARASASTGRPRRADPREDLEDLGRANQTIELKDVFANRRVGRRRTDRRAARGHGSEPSNQLMQSAQAWLRRNNRCPVGPALTPAGPPGSTCASKELATFG